VRIVFVVSFSTTRATLFFVDVSLTLEGFSFSLLFFLFETVCWGVVVFLKCGKRLIYDCLARWRLKFIN
jgi:hypothetical protein